MNCSVMRTWNLTYPPSLLIVRGSRYQGYVWLRILRDNQNKRANVYAVFSFLFFITTLLHKNQR